MEEDEKPFPLSPQPPNWVAKLISLQADVIYRCFVSGSTPFSVASESYHQAEETRDNVESAVNRMPSAIILLFKRLGLGFLSAAYVCMVLLLVLLLAVVLGVGLVHLWAEEPVFAREELHFDYTDAHPTAVFSFDAGLISGLEGYSNNKQIGIPIGHTFYISLVLVMPESDFNREIGVFQLSAELLSVNGNVTVKSSQPIMLRYRSFPVRLARTLIMGMPLLLGISEETQKINVEILKHKEDNRRTKAIKAIMCPRAGTSSLPQIYKAEIVMNSQLPGAKQLVHNWKWTFYVWVSLYIYTVLLMILLCCCRPLTFMVVPKYMTEHGSPTELRSAEAEESQMREADESEVSELLRKWRRSRSKRKAMLTQGGGAELEAMASSASSTTMTREEVTSTAVEDVGDSESVCLI
ncbi:seipin-1-like [Neltuma alba]|uniref:seipin-1-like n=1 Tax=Neltuma alba TaxID=207710 RepID=UPI0010A2DA98|nr:seipin-1-like [Prosopis alba]